MSTEHLFQKHYFLRPGFIDGTSEFHRLLAARINPGSSILEIGAGPTNPTTDFLATLGCVTGVDVTDEIEQNRALADRHIFDGVHLPYCPNSFDACVSNWVIEHVEDPAAHFREIARILRPGGMYYFRTPNKWHYFTLGSRMLPYSVHLRVANKLRGLSEEAHDPYPKYYRANSLGRIRQMSGSAGLVPVELAAIEKEPSYGRLHPLLFYPMFLYERSVNSWDALKVFRSSILGALQKRCSSDDRYQS